MKANSRGESVDRTSKPLNRSQMRRLLSHTDDALSLNKQRLSGRLGLDSLFVWRAGMHQKAGNQAATTGQDSQTDSQCRGRAGGWDARQATKDQDTQADTQLRRQKASLTAGTQADR